MVHWADCMCDTMMVQCNSIVNVFLVNGVHYCWSPSVFPTHVGVFPEEIRSLDMDSSFPHTCGGVPLHLHQ